MKTSVETDTPKQTPEETKGSFPEPKEQELDLIELFQDQGFADSFYGYKDNRPWRGW